ncbi:conserved hypothetical protein (plasmid) [Bacillus anthracis str. A0488]|uniref:Uncharacterized protein n=1 Tax=Bacillus anthracis TaxID=1392 RepID=Q6F070_BACAN|nr:hypothetical protein BX_B0108 [Bacillus anthracis str. A2012]AAT35520.1 conserved hypothetical protein [Bacillus anthracis str. 'Ames Ancestor']EDR16207.1 conserved hypothetical protein [Bacillus anthracis str. A0488]EDR85169.1 conserved hypothetical protein [Bacillus anthracis str. A0193]
MIFFFCCSMKIPPLKKDHAFSHDLFRFIYIYI